MATPPVDGQPQGAEENAGPRRPTGSVAGRPEGPDAERSAGRSNRAFLDSAARVPQLSQTKGSGVGSPNRSPGPAAGAVSEILRFSITDARSGSATPKVSRSCLVAG